MKCAAPRRAMSAGVAPMGAVDVHLDAEVGQQPRDLGHVVAVAEAERGGAEEVAGHARGALHGAGQRADDLEEGLVGAEVLAPLVARQLQRDDGDGQAHLRGEPPGVVLDQLGGAGRADDDRLGPEALVGVAAGVLEELRRVRAEVAGLEGGVGDGRTPVAPLDHGEQQVRVGVALRRVKHVVQPAHRGGDAHRADMRRALVCPDRELHSAASSRGERPAIWDRRRSGREKRPARSPACS